MTSPSSSERATLVLASASPRRLELLAQIGVTPDRVAPADIDERPHRKETPRKMVARLAAAKLAHVAAPGVFTLAADTIVAVGRRVLGKPKDGDEARRFLALLSGRNHKVITAIAVAAPDGRIASREVETRVTMKRLSTPEINAYIASDEWRGKAGGYGIQGMASAFIPSIVGSYSAVVGLPLTETAGLLEGLGYPLWAAK